MLRSKQQKTNQTKKHPARPSRAWRRTAQRGSSRQGAEPRRAPGPRPARPVLAGSTPPKVGGERRREGASSLPSLPFQRPTPRARGAPRRNRPRRERGRAASRTRPLLPTMPVEGTAGLRWACWGGAVHSRALWLQPVPVTLVSGCLGPAPLVPSTPCATNLVRESAGHRSLCNQPPWGLTPTPRADAVLERWGTQAPLAPHEGAPGQPDQDHP